MSWAAAKSIAEIVSALSLAATALWAGIQFRRARLATRARWIANLYSRFYLDKPLAEHRHHVESSYDSAIAEKVQGWLRNPPDPRYPEFRTADDAEPSLDLVLGFLEMIADLNQRNQLKEPDVDALFDYWLRWIGSHKRPELRLYLNTFGYEGVARLAARAGGDAAATQLENPRLVAVYGSLRPDSRGVGRFTTFAQTRGRTIRNISTRGTGTISADLVSLGAYPAARLGSGTTRVVILEVESEADLRLMDAFEDQSPEGPGTFVRSFIPVTWDNGDGLHGAWVYLYRGSHAGDPVPGGDWVAYEASQVNAAVTE